MRRTSIVGPLLLVGVGIIFLLLELGRLHWDSLLPWFARWWPLVLVMAGMLLVCEWALDTWTASQRNTSLPRRTLGGGASFLLILLVAFGLTAVAFEHGSDWMHRNFDYNFADASNSGLTDLFGSRTETTEELSAPLNPGSVFTIQNYRGDITVSGASQDGQVHVTVHQRLFAWQRNELEARRRNNKPRFLSDGPGLLLAVNGEGHDQADLTVQVPHESALQIDGERGEIAVAEMRGAVTVQDHSGNVVLTALAGPVHVTMRDDNASVSGHSLSGEVRVEGRSGDLTFSDVQGPLELHGDFFGTTHLERIHGGVQFQSSFTDFACAGIPGEVNVEGRSELQARGIEGPVTISTTDRNLTLSGVRGAATLNDRNGSVTLTARDPLGPIRITTTDGSIKLGLPQGSAFSLSAQTADGQVTDEFGLKAQQQGDRTNLSGQVKAGGPLIALQTTEGDITVQKRTSENWTDDDDQSSQQIRPDPAPANAGAASRGGNRLAHT